MNYIAFDEQGEIKRLWIESKEICELLNISRSTLWRLVKTDHFPPPVRFANDFLRWRIADVNDYLAHKYQQAQGTAQ